MGPVDVAGVAGEDELVVVVLAGEHAGHVFVGDDPVVESVAHGVWGEEVSVADLHPDPEGFGGGVGDELLVELPGTVRGLRVRGPLLIDVGSGVGEDTAVKFGVVPGHDEGAGAS